MMCEKDMTKYKALILEVFKNFISFCEDNRLNYFCCGGTAIGAVRHAGMIPWDDDIDVLMPRPDYDRFLELFPTAGYKGCELVFAERVPSYYLPFAKLVDTHSSVVEYPDIPCVLGAFIDIFPLDGTSSNKGKQVELIKQFRQAANKLLVIPKYPINNFKAGLKRMCKGQLRTALNEFMYSVGKNRARKRVLKQLSYLMSSYAYKYAPYVANYGGMWGIREIGKHEWFDGYCKMEFEGFSVRLPKDYHAYLTHVYGNYMVPPSLENRASHHHFAYVNLHERIDIRAISFGGGDE